MPPSRRVSVDYREPPDVHLSFRPAIMRSSPRARRALQLCLALLVMAALAWSARRAILVGAASLLVNEDPLSQSDVMVVSNIIPRATALEAAVLYKQQISPRVLMTGWVHDPLVEKTRELGIPYLDAPAISRLILEHSGVPPSAITVLPDEVDGTNSELAAIAAYASRAHLASLLIITARSHTARSKRLLRRALPGVRVSVRSSRFDAFRVDAWWRERDQGREIVTEYLRMYNSVLLGDVWAHSSSGHGRVTTVSRNRTP